MTEPGAGQIWRAPAKVNLGLRVGRRAAGSPYHPLDSLMVALDLADELAVEPGPGEGLLLVVEGAAIPGPNLVERAWRWYRELGGPATGLRVVLHKRIPVAAGLGGGSSDAAALLRGLAGGRTDAPWLDGSRAGPALGMDVPFFLSGRPAARVGGFGERVAPAPGPPAAWGVLLARPALAVSTARVFAAYDAAGLGPSASVDPVAAALATGRLPEALPNDLESALYAAHPELSGFRERLNAALAATGLRYVLGLSGSGPTFVALVPEAPPGSAAAAVLEAAMAPVAPWFRLTRCGA
ncbi:4-diphosphocytidyl-2-C-methyl-D-erythritol kinase [Candidatus Hydrogenisulfobacillus filiaventi]|uniref:4-diphosphocytidyl-2-C-methyl-D-erythritol kinase n=1 Tax=Candidatus Hydrogenisulfobacillus filiaventi TaxID=2707344 RepID=A0A6F8ZKB2_9FIRM|nr:4-(cytidine 5'-diphospho)-2-C-methyl-D-erythritol kinase [Bacillota bacterium]CAB1130123.1 4-diphosphocytidyl-2-C-methyl-D-erythritol kinase [Candidatus Hydrogenisulfobacillus filiaventi]